MRIARLALLATVFAVISSQGFAADKPTGPTFSSRVGYEEGADFKYERTIAPGIRHVFESRAAGPLTYNTAFIDTSRPDLTIEVEKGKGVLRGAESLPAMMKRLADPNARPLVGINGDFWAAKDMMPINMFVDAGTIWKLAGRPEGKVSRTVFAFDDKKNLFIGIPDVTASVTNADGSQSLPIDQVNEGDDKATVSIYNWVYGDKLPAVADDVKQIVLTMDGEEWLPNAPAKGHAALNKTGDIKLDHKTVLLHVRGNLPVWLTDGAAVNLKVDFKNLPGKVLGVVGGGPRLLVNGEEHLTDWEKEEGTGMQFITDLHPRTAIGIMPDHKTLVFVVVDGRQPHKSIGNSLPTLAAYMKSIGCETAMNMDGGGSSSMVVGPDVVSFPSDAGGPRSLATGVIVCRTAPLGPLAKVALVPAKVTVPPGAAVDFGAAGYDAAGEILPLDGDRLSLGARESKEGTDWVATQSLPTVSVTSDKSEEVSATLLTMDNRQFAADPAEVSVVKASNAEFVPHELLLSVKDEDQLALHFTNDSGTKYFAGAYMNNISVPDFLDYDPATHTVKALKEGAGKITFEMDGKTIEAPVAVDKFAETLVDSFDTLPSPTPDTWMVLANANAKGTHITLDTEKKKEGAASWKFAYVMAPGGTTKITLPIAQDIPGNPPALGLWIYGDGNGHWLRGELEDSKGGVFYADFTNTKAGIFWRDWKFARATMLDPSVLKSDHPTPVGPFKLRNLYLIQPQEAAKKTGVIWIDGLTELDVPK